VTTHDALSDEKLRDLLKGANGFRRDHPRESWVCMPEQNLFALIREFATATRAEERRRCLRACRDAKTASDARSRIRALTEETSPTKRKGKRAK
jgi:hypothetical protein